MKLELRAKGVRMTDGLRRFIEKKLRFALGRFSHRVPPTHLERPA